MTLRRLLFILLVVFCCAAGALAGLAALFGTSTGLDLVRRTAQWGSTRVLHGRMTIGRLEGTAWGRLVIHDLSMALPDSLGGEVIRVNRAEITPDLRALLAGRYRLKAVTVDGFWLVYIDGVGPRKTDTISLLFGLGLGPPPATPEPPFPLSIPAVTITRGEFLYFDQGNSTTFQVRDIAIRGTITDEKHLSGVVQASWAMFSVNGVQDSLAAVASDFRLHGDSLTVARLTMQAAALPPLAIQASGSIAPLSGYVAAITLRADGDAGAIGRLIGVDTTLKGAFHLTGSITSTLRDPSVEGRLEAAELDTDIGRVIQAALDLRYAHDRLTVDRYTGLTEAGQVSGSGLLDFSQPIERYRLTLEPSTIALERLPATLVGSGLPLSGSATLSAEISGAGFDHPELSGTASVTVPSLVVAGTPVGAVSAQVRYDRGRVTLTARAPAAAVEANGTLTTTGVADITAAITIPNLRAFTTLFGDSSAAGTASLTAAVRGPITHPDIQLDGQIAELGYAGIALGTLRVTGGLDQTGIARLQTDLDRSTVVLSVQADRARDWLLSGTLAIHRFRLRDHLAVVTQDWDLDGEIEMEGTIQGRLHQPEFRGNGLVRNLSIRGERLGSASLALTLNHERDLRFTLVTSEFSVVSNGLLSLTHDLPFTLNLDVTRADLAPLLAVFMQQKTHLHTGRFSGRVQALGLAAHPELSTVTVTLDSLAVSMGESEVQLAAPSTVRLEKQVVTVDRLELSGQAGRLVLQGTAGLTADGPLHTEMVLEGMQLEFLSPFLLSRGILSGAVDFRVAMTGSPVAPLLDGALQTGSIQYSSENRLNELGAVKASLMYVDRVLHIPTLSIDTPFGTSRAVATFPIDLSWAGSRTAPSGEQFTVSVLMDHLSVGPLREFIPDIPPDLSGRVNGRLELTGPMTNPRASVGIVRLDSLRVHAYQYELVNVESLIVRFDAGHLDVDPIRVVFRPLDQPRQDLGTIIAAGRIALGSPNGQAETSDFSVTGRGIALKAPVELAGWDVPLTGTLDGHVRLTGPVSAQSAEGTVHLTRVTYNAASIDSIIGRFVYEQGVLIVHEFLAWVRERTLSAYGTIPFEQTGSEAEPGRPADMALTVEGSELDLQFLNGITYDLERIEGKADIHLRVGGTPFAPKSVGDIVIRAGTVQVREIRPPIQVPRLRLAVDGDRITLEPVVIKMGRGSIQVEGSTVLRNFSVAQFESRAATMSTVDLELVGSARLAVNGTLAFMGTPHRSRMDGRLRVTGTVIEPLNLQELALGGGVLRPAFPPSPFLERMALNIEVDIPQLRVRNNLADVGVEGGFAIINTAQNPILTGSASATDGFIMYLGTKFELESGRVEITKREPLESFSMIFDDPIQQLDPVVTLQTRPSFVTDIYETKYEVTFTLDGRVTAPKLELKAEPVRDALSSDASLQEAITLYGPDVLSLLTLGLPGLRPPPRWGATGAFTGVGNRALMMATGKQAERLLKLDEVRIEGDIFNATPATEPTRITISKRINRRTEVTYTQSVAEGAPYKLRIGYRLSEYLFIETSTEETGQTQQSGLDLKLKFRFQ